MCNEIKSSRGHFKAGTQIDTLYFGGGTPSILDASEIDTLMRSLDQSFNLSSVQEITLEANPDDLNEDFLKDLKSLNFNRLSIGVQSLNNDILEWMNRSHNAEQAYRSVHNAAEQGFESINVDLIYGVPGLGDKEWQSQLIEVFSWPVDHLSAYSLTLEEKTAYAHYVKKGSHLPPSEEAAIKHYRILQQSLPASWKQYEVSNYCKYNAVSRHNSAYWSGEAYLGIGPSAHGFDIQNRYWNVSSNASYVQSKGLPSEIRTIEVLNEVDSYNEFIMTRLRTREGVNVNRIKELFGVDLLRVHKGEIQQWIELGYMEHSGSMLRLTSEGLLLSDSICSELFKDHSSQMSS